MATIDTSIYGNIKPVQIEDPINQFARQQELSVNMLKAREMQQASENRNMMRQLDPSDPEYINKISRFDPKLGAELSKSRLEGDEKRLKMAGDSTKFYMDALPSINNPQQMAELTIAQYNDPHLGPVLKRVRPLEQALATIPTDPRGFELYKQKAGMGMKDFITHTTLSAYQLANLNKPVFSAEAGGFVIPPRVGGGGGGVSAGGAGGGSGAGSGIMPAAGGVIPVEGVKPKSTEAEKQAAYNTKRILTAAKDISKAVENNPSAIAPGFFEAIAPGEGAANLARSSDRQLVSSGYADLIDAALYLATGAAYNKEQLEAQKKALLPAFTDTEENRQSKQLKIIELINAAKIRAGKEWTPELDKAVNNLFPSLREAPPINVEGVGTKVNTPGSKATPAAPAAANTVKLPNGAVKVFPTPEAAAQFRQAAGL